ncbi:hypothetical protein [Streptomyces sp. WAC 01325]|uniref:hypothetical protein n=1 Tax=Streptomyces sp. WAC 01325 TaxID=2203202 RepID=UPI000F876C72|nr:hypothetical protein [Streptomyces sp. WAC 01325]
MIVAPDVPARHRAILAVGNPWYTDHGRDMEVGLAFAGGAFMFAMPLGVASYCLAHRVADVRWWEMLLLPHVAYAGGALLASAGTAVLLKWAVLNGPPLIGQALSRRAYRRLAVRYAGRFITVSALEERCRPLARRAQRAVQIVLSDSVRHRVEAIAEDEGRLRGALWKIARDLQDLSELVAPADKAASHPDADEDLVVRAFAAVTARVEALEEEAAARDHGGRAEAEIHHTEKAQAVGSSEAAHHAVLRHEALLDLVARAEGLDGVEHNL